MRRALPVALAFAALLPTVAFAVETGPVVMSLKSGVPAELLGKTLGVAKSLFALSLILGLLVEAFGASPTTQKNYAGVVWRALLVLALLWGYRVLFGSVISTAQGIADRIAPSSIYAAFGQHNIQAIEALQQKAHADAAASNGGTFSSLTAAAKVVTGYVGGALFDGLVLVFVALGQALHWAFIQFSRILVGVLYVLGPLALVFHIPAPSDVATRWFRAFVTVASWPIFTAVLLAMATALLMRTDEAAVFGQYSTAFGALGSTVLIVLMCLAAPLMASAVVGGSLKNVPLESLMAASFGAAAMGRLFSKNARAGGEETAAQNAVAQSGSVPVAASGASTSVAPSGGASVPVPSVGSAPSSAGGAARPTVGFSAVPSMVAVPVAGESPVAYDAIDKTAAKGPGRARGEGSLAGAWKLPKPKGLGTGDMTVSGRPTAGVAAGVATPVGPVPAKFDSADWDDVGK
jgi:hypothetical protein